MRVRLLCMLLSSTVLWFGISVMRTSDAVEAACQSAHGVFMRLPYEAAKCVSPGNAVPASSTPRPRAFATRPIDV